MCLNKFDVLGHPTAVDASEYLTCLKLSKVLTYLKVQRLISNSLEINRISHNVTDVYYVLGGICCRKIACVYRSKLPHGTEYCKYY